MLLQSLNHLANRGVHELDVGQHGRRRRARCVRIAAFHAAFDQLLAHAHGLKVHAEDVRHGSSLSSEVGLPADPVHDRIHFQLVVALNVHKTIDPGATIWIRDGAAGQPGGRRDARQRNDVGIHVGRVVVIHVAGHCRAGRSRHRGVDRVLVRPGGAAAGGMDHSVNGVGPDEVPGIDGARTAPGSKTDRGQFRGVDRQDPPSIVL